jgi:hypothetical protein
MNDVISRRQFLEATLAATATATLAGPALGAQGSDAARQSAIRNENLKPGTSDWQLTRVRVDRGQGNQPGVRSRWIEGYASRQSVRAGESIDLMVSTNPPAPFTIEVFRTGYYGGKGARAMTKLGPFPGVVQPDPAPDDRRVIECRWKPATTLTIPSDWPSGVYLGRLTTVPDRADEPYWQSYIIFIVRDERPVDVLFQCSDSTWQAYNRWPTRFSLYDDGSANEWTTRRGITVGFDRPYGKYRQIYENPQTVGSGEFLCWEFPLSYWLEQHGYDVAYCSNSDMLTPGRGLKSKCFVSIGHDEYWDERQYHSVKAMIDAGVNVLFLSGNSVSGVTPFSPSSDGRPNRIITRTSSYGGWAGAGEDGPPGARKKQADFGPDEGLLMGARNVSPVNGGGDWIVTKPGHWMFEGTGMKAGDRIPGLVGWEYHGNPAKIPGLEVVAEGTAWRGGDVAQHWTATVYPGPRRNFVFNAATIFWSQALSSPPGHMLPWSHWNRPHGPDERVQRIARNLFDRALATGG